MAFKWAWHYHAVSLRHRCPHFMLLSGPTTINGNRRTGHKGRSLRRHKYDCACKFLWVAPAAQWDPIDKPVELGRICHQWFVHLGEERSWCQGVDGDAFARHFECYSAS